MLGFDLLFVCVLGLILGSFLAALTWRLPREISVSNGRSFCPNCRKKIKWYDNIPVLSFFLLGGKCRNCKKPISSRYPTIEISTSFLFAMTFLSLERLMQNIDWLWSVNPLITLPYLLFIAFVFLGIFIVDLEEMIIPDELVFIGIAVTLIVFLLSGQSIYVNLFAGFLFGSLFLLLNLLTRGRGMGLGDAKLAVLIGIIVGLPTGFISLLASFVIGALVGVALIVLGKAKLQQKIAFGPFLVIGFFISLLFANEITRFF